MGADTRNDAAFYRWQTVRLLSKIGFACDTPKHVCARNRDNGCPDATADVRRSS